jgi:hypothetical protein
MGTAYMVDLEGSTTPMTITSFSSAEDVHPDLSQCVEQAQTVTVLPARIVANLTEHYQPPFTLGRE